MIQDADVDALAALLNEGFAGRKLAFWQAGLARLASRPLPEGTPRYGYCLDAGGKLVGVLLLIASHRPRNGMAQPFTNVASWYVQENFRAYAQLLVSMALKSKTTTYFNVSAAPHTWPIVEKQGYRMYCAGLYFAFAVLAPKRPGVEIIDINTSPDHAILGTMNDGELLRRHADLGCRVLVCRTGGEATGFVFRRLAARAGRLKLPAMMVLYASGYNRLQSLAGNLGRYLLPEAAPILIFDAMGKVPGIPGLFTDRRGRKFAKGPHTPELCALADTELAIFGI